MNRRDSLRGRIRVASKSLAVLKDAPVKASDRVRSRKEAHSGESANEGDGVAEGGDDHGAVFRAAAGALMEASMSVIHAVGENSEQRGDCSGYRSAPKTLPRRSSQSLHVIPRSLFVHRAFLLHPIIVLRRQRGDVIGKFLSHALYREGFFRFS